MYILGLSGALGHDASATLLHNGQIIASAEEERFIRDKHAKNKMPSASTQFCLDFANIKCSDVDIIAIPFAPISLFSKARWHFAKRYWYAPDRALDALFNGNRRFRRYKNNIIKMLTSLGFDTAKIQLVPVEHHLAHASSAYHLSGFKEKSAILCIDGKGEYATTLLGYGEHNKIHKIKEFYDPDSLGGMYGALTEYLGFEMLDGEFKVMGMAPYGDPNKHDFSRLMQRNKDKFKINTKLVNTIGLRRYKENGKGYYFSNKLIDWLGPKREGDDKDEPYIDYAASIQHLLEETVLELIDHYLKPILEKTGKLCYAGGVALNVKLNQRILELPYVKELFVQPASGDAGTSLGAATYVANQMGYEIEKMPHAYLGPQFTNEACITACESHPNKPSFTRLSNTTETAADLLANGNPLAWFQGRMEFGPRALGNRSILGDPSHPGIADRINAQIKFRERWRPFCPSMLDSVAKDIIQTNHPAPYMTITFDVNDNWKARIPEVVHEDGTARAQIVSKDSNARYHELISNLEKRTGNGVVLNTSLNRRGEPMVCSPTDALNMFFGCDLEYLIMEDILVQKKTEVA